MVAEHSRCTTGYCAWRRSEGAGGSPARGTSREPVRGCRRNLGSKHSRINHLGGFFVKLPRVRPVLRVWRGCEPPSCLSKMKIRRQDSSTCCVWHRHLGHQGISISGRLGAMRVLHWKTAKDRSDAVRAIDQESELHPGCDGRPSPLPPLAAAQAPQCTAQPLPLTPMR